MSLPLSELREIQLLKKEVEALGEALNNEKLERRLELDRVTLELETLRQVLQTHVPQFKQECEKVFHEVRKNLNPETLRTGT